MIRFFRISSRLHAAALMIIIALWIWFVYSPATEYGFVTLDDNLYVYENSHVSEGLTSGNIRWAFTNTDTSLWIPVTWLTFLADSTMAGLDPGRFHLTNILFHIAGALILYIVLAGATGALWRSAFVAGLFALHPLQVESVAWITERKDVVSVFLLFVTMYAYVRYARRPSRMKYCLVFIFASMSMLAKPMTVTAPVLLLILDGWPLGRLKQAGSLTGRTSLQYIAAAISRWVTVNRRVLMEKVPLIAVAGLITVVTGTAAGRDSAMVTLDRLPVIARVGQALVSYTAYLWAVIHPVRLAVFYPRDGTAPSAGMVIAAAMLLMTVSVVVVRLRRHAPFFAVGWTWFLVALLPVIGLFQTGMQVRADRFTYLPVVGLFIMVAWGLSALIRNRQRTDTAVFAGIGCIAMLVVLSVLTRTQLGRWRDSITLFSHTVAVTDDNWMALNSLAAGYEQIGDTLRAMEKYSEAIRLNPDFTYARYNLGRLMLVRGDYEGAADEFGAVLTVRFDLENLRFFFGYALEHLGRYDDALEQYEYVRTGDARYDETLARRASIRYELGNRSANAGLADDAVRQYRQALELRPDYPEALNNLANVLEYMGDYAGAVTLYERALELRPGSAILHRNIADALERLDRNDEAANHLREAERLESPGETW